VSDGFDMDLVCVEKGRLPRSASVVGYPSGIAKNHSSRFRRTQRWSLDQIVI
jgi:hypothetical protein